MNSNNTFTLITGASSGIGKAIAWYCGSKKMNLLLISLPNEGLGQVANEIQQRHGVIAYFMETDLASIDGPKTVYNWVHEKNFNINVLVNNAGVAGTTVFEKSDPEYSDVRIMVNIRALVLLTRHFLPMLKKNEKAYILNVSSLSAYFSIPYKTVYSASKTIVLNFSRALRYELKGSPISISVVCPNGVRTNAGTHARIEAHGTIATITTISPELLATIAIENMLKGKFLIIPLRINRLLLLLQKIIPTDMQQKILTREFMKEVKVS